jgi:exoribonuclease R
MDRPPRHPLRVPQWPQPVPAPPDFAAIRTELGVPEEFPAEALAEAGRVAARPPLPEADATDVDLVTVDPPGSRDLDQAVHLAGRGNGFRVTYAIADVGGFVRLGGALDAETRRRGQTVYSPDRRVPLHPTVLSEGAASLLPGQVVPAVVWTLDLDADGELAGSAVRRAAVRSRAQLDYGGVQAQADAGTLPAPLALLPRIGSLLLARAADRGAIELGTPEQEVRSTPDGGWTIGFRGDLPVETWNAQISLLTGRCAAGLMLDGGVGVLRTLPPARPEDVERLRLLAPVLGVDWPAGAAPGAVISGLDAGDPRRAAFLEEAATLLRGSGYTAFDGAAPAQPVHAGVGAPYAHVTAPLRRLVDRFATEVCLALAAGREPGDDLRAVLPALPSLMGASDRRTHEVERAVVDATEAWLLRGQEGRDFPAVALDDSTVVLDGFAVRARCTGPLTPGDRLQVRLVKADVATRTVLFEKASPRAVS